MKIIIHNDDFGINQSFNNAIIDCAKNGLTSSTSVRVNGTDYNKKSLEDLKQLKIGVGLHLNLTDGKTSTKQLANIKGDYRYKFQNYFIKLFYRNNKLLKSIERDLEGQFRQAVKIDKLKIDHVNGHDHIHTIPHIFDVTCKLCKKYNIKYIRACNEPLYVTGNASRDIKPLYNANIIKHILLRFFSHKNKWVAKKYNLNYTDSFYGILFTDNMDENTVKAAIKNAQKKHFKVVEILLHPAYYQKHDRFTSDFIRKYTSKPARKVEADTLKSKKLAVWLKKQNIELVNFGDI